MPVLRQQSAFLEQFETLVCADVLDIDNFVVKLPEPPPQKPRWSRTPKSAVVTMIVILVAMALVSLYSNVQRWRRSKIENVTVTPLTTPSPSERVP